MSFLLLILEFYKTNARLIINFFIKLFDLKGILQFCKIKSENFLDLNLNLDLTLVSQIKMEKVTQKYFKESVFSSIFLLSI